MAIALGTGSTIEVAIDGATKTFATLGFVTGGTLDVTSDVVEMTNNDSGGNKEFLYGDTLITLKADVKYEPTNTAQTNLMAYTFNKTDATSTFLSLRVRPIVGSGLEQWVFRALITNFSISMPHGEGITVSFSAQSNAAATTPGTPIPPVITVQ